MQHLATAWNWIVAHQLIAWIILSAICNLALRARSADKWIEWCARYPRVASVLRLLRAIGVDPAKALEAGVAAVNGKARVDWATALPNTPTVRAIVQPLIRDTDPDPAPKG